MAGRVAVVIPTLNAGPQFARLLEALQTQTLPVSELVIIDSGSHDGTLELARAAGARVLTIPGRQFNHGRARNQAIAATQSDLVALTVQDALPTGPDWLAHLCAPLLENSTLAASYGLQRVPDSAPPLARVRGLMWERSCPPAGVQEVVNPAAFWALVPEERLQRARFDDVSACLRRSAWELQPLPAASYAEDLAWSVQALLRGWRIAWTPEAQVWHYHHRSADYEFRRAFADGMIQARWLRWPAPEMTVRQALALWREARRPQLATRYTDVTHPVHLREVLWQKEVTVIEQYPDELFVHLYREAVDFSWGLIVAGEEIYPAEAWPKTLWPEIATFATVAVFGMALGLAAAQYRGPFWWAIRWMLGRRV